MVRAIVSALRVAVPLKTRCSMRWDMPARPSGSWREPGSTQTPTATPRTWGIRPVTMRMPFGSRLFRYSSVTGRVRRVGVPEPFLLGQRRLLAERDLAREPHLTVAVDLDHLDGDLVAFAQHVLDGADTRLGDLRDVQQPLGIGNHFDERAELHDLLDLAHVDPVQLHLSADVLDHGDRLLDGGAVRRGYRHPAVVLDVDLRSRLVLDGPDYLASGADDLADLLGPDLDRDKPRRVGAELGAWLLDRLSRLGQHEQARLTGVGQRRAHDLQRDAGDLRSEEHTSELQSLAYLVCRLLLVKKKNSY